MARPKEFDTDVALDAAVGVFGEHGFEGSSSAMLVEAMGIGRQSLYDTFGDKWQLYQKAVRRYAQREQAAHLGALRGTARAIDGIEALVRRVVDTATQPCLGVGSVCEFGVSRPDLLETRAPFADVLLSAIAGRVHEAQQDGHIPADLDPQATAGFLITSIAGIRIAGRGGADKTMLGALAELVFRALR